MSRTLAFMLASSAALAQSPSVPLFIHHSGRLLDGADNLVEGPLQLHFSIHDVFEDEPGSEAPPLWQGTYDVVLFRGVYHVTLGDPAEGPLLDAAVFDGAKRLWLQIRVGGPTAPPLEPRIKVGSVPFALTAGTALRALSATSLEGAALDDLAPAEHTHGAADLVALPTHTHQAADLPSHDHVAGDLMSLPAHAHAAADLTTLPTHAHAAADLPPHDHDLSGSGFSGLLPAGKIDRTGLDADLLDGLHASAFTRKFFAEKDDLQPGAFLEVNHGGNTLLTMAIGWVLDASGAWRAITEGGACTACGNGSDGAFLATSDRTLGGGTYNFSSFTIQSGVRVTVTGTTPLTVNVAGAARIEGTLWLRGGDGGSPPDHTAGCLGTGGSGGGGGGFAGGTSCYSGSGQLSQDGFGPGGGKGGDYSSCSNGGGGGGGGFGSDGAAGQALNAGPCSNNCAGGAGGAVYGDADLSVLQGGSGGGSGSYGGATNNAGGGGGGGGGAVKITAQSIVVSGAINANGGTGGGQSRGTAGGGDGGLGGGGSGGAIWLRASGVQISGTVQATGGVTGNYDTSASPWCGGAGGTGGNGRIRIDAQTLSGTTTPAPHRGNTSGLPASYALRLEQFDANKVRLYNEGPTPAAVRLVVIR
jgi:hypothetical protein